ncbi:hypothetical protein CLOM_g7744 [Closterium sp. NIES-68]|nr:hypothetical protein CLOM_g7744 [Closterium sp. NIES-68]GJP81256.1 hypothetical protein CLOP_g11417 [Closterium sp. NIES-67]
MQGQSTASLAAAALAAVEEEHRRLIGDFFTPASTGQPSGNIPASVDPAAVCGSAAELVPELCGTPFTAVSGMGSHSQSIPGFAIGSGFHMSDLSRAADAASEHGSFNATLPSALAAPSNRLPILQPLTRLGMGEKSALMHSNHGVAGIPHTSNNPNNAAAAAVGSLAAAGATSSSASSLDSFSRFITTAGLPFACNSPPQLPPRAVTAIHAASAAQTVRPRLEQHGIPGSPSSSFPAAAGFLEMGRGGGNSGVQPDHRLGAGAAVAGRRSHALTGPVMGAHAQAPASDGLAVEGRGERGVGAIPGMDSTANVAAQELHLAPIGRAIGGVGEWVMAAGGGAMAQGMAACRMPLAGGEQARSRGLASCSSAWGPRADKAAATTAVEHHPMAQAGQEALVQQLWMQQLGLREEREKALAKNGAVSGLDKGAEQDAWAAAMVAGGREQGEAARGQVDAAGVSRNDKEHLAQQMMALQALLAAGDYSALAQGGGEGQQQPLAQQQAQQAQAQHKQGQQSPQGVSQQQSSQHRKAQDDGVPDSRGLQVGAWQHASPQVRHPHGSHAHGSLVLPPASMRPTPCTPSAAVQETFTDHPSNMSTWHDLIRAQPYPPPNPTAALDTMQQGNWSAKSPGGLVAAIGGQSGVHVGAEALAAQENSALGEVSWRNGSASSERDGGVRVHRAGTAMGTGDGEQGQDEKADGGGMAEAGMEDVAWMDAASGRPAGGSMGGAQGGSVAAGDTDVAGGNSDDLTLEWSRRMRRMKSNRESAKRARVKRQRRLHELEVLTSSLQRENAELSKQVVVLSQQVQQGEEQKEKLEKEVAALRACALAIGSGGGAATTPITPTTPSTHSTLSTHTAQNPFTLPPTGRAHAAHGVPQGGGHGMPVPAAAAATSVVGNLGGDEGVEGVAADGAELPASLDENLADSFV